jgi:two-component system chemotaxis response regulator CheY
VLVLTTESGEDLKSKARRAGATGWIVKPFDDNRLVSVINRVLGV